MCVGYWGEGGGGGGIKEAWVGWKVCTLVLPMETVVREFVSLLELELN